MRILRAVWRFLLLLVHIILGIIATVVYSGLLRRSYATPSYRRLVRWWLGRVVHILGGRVTVTGTPAAEPVLMVCNHISWLDIPLLGGQSSIRFLSKSEVSNWPVVGWLANKAGTLYIERGRRGASQDASDKIAESLRQGDAVMLFPEGKTGDGTRVMPFHARLFGSAIEAGVPVQPVAIYYRNASGEPAKHVPYIDDMSLWDSLTGLLPEPSLNIEVHYLPPLTLADDFNRKTLARVSETQIRQTLSL